jgi:hypothetical protein
MRFLVASEPTPDDTEEIVVCLELERGWNDFNVRTRFSVTVHIPGARPMFSGVIKIIAKEASGSSEGLQTKDLLPREFRELDPNAFASAGQTEGYYRQMGAMPDDVGREVLRALGDIAFSSASPWWPDHPLYDKSLLRETSAKRAFAIARAAFDQRRDAEELQHHIDYRKSNGRANGGPDRVPFNFDGTLEVPGRMNVVVGKNGVGKTSLLAGLARWFSRDLPVTQFDHRPEFSKVVVVTYNPFDSEYRAPAADDEANVRFVGRQPLPKALVATLEALEAADEADWLSSLTGAFPTHESMKSLLEAVSIERGVVDTLDQLRHHEDWRAFLLQHLAPPDVVDALLARPRLGLRELGAGQRALVGLFAAMFLHVDRKSLVLIDEPENHLHPSLISAFAKMFNEFLDARRSFAIVATHSPILLQETPSRFVQWLTRNDDVTTAENPAFETFGESIDSITERLFETDFDSSHWKFVMRKLSSQGVGWDALSAKVSGIPLSMFAMSYFATVKRAGITE